MDSTRANFRRRRNLEPLRPAAELFAAFTPQPKDLDESVARRAFALVQQLDTGSSLPPPSLMTVFHLYCVQALSTDQVARKCACSKATVLNRLARIREKTGIDPSHLRTLSPQIAQVEDQLSDPRARHLNRLSAIENQTDDD